MKSSFSLNSKTYTFQGLDGNTESWGHTSTGAFAGRAVLKHSPNVPVNKGAAYRQNWNLKVPVLATEDSACSCAGSILRENTVSVTAHFAASGTTAERQDILDQLDDLLADADFRAAFLAGNLLA